MADKFHVGQLVRCVDPLKRLKYGEYYKVAKLGGRDNPSSPNLVMIRLHNGQIDGGYNICRFRAASRRMEEPK